MEEIKLKGLNKITPQTIKVEKIKIPTSEEAFILDANFLYFMARIKSVRPKTKAIFATLEPITFPTTILNFPLKAANKLVNISGAEVPNAITVEPIKNGDTPNFKEEAMEYLSSR